MSDLLHAKIPPIAKRRESLMQLRLRHLEKVDRVAKRANYNRADMHELLLTNYDRLFGPLRRPKTKEVPSDAFRKSWMIGNLLDIIEARRDELLAKKEEAAYAASK
jgi:hypothetical protein